MSGEIYEKARVLSCRNEIWQAETVRIGILQAVRPVTGGEVRDHILKAESVMNEILHVGSVSNGDLAGREC